MNILNKVLTLSLNSAWQPIGHKTVQDAMGDLFSENYLALNVEYENISHWHYHINNTDHNMVYNGTTVIINVKECSKLSLGLQ